MPDGNKISKWSISDSNLFKQCPRKFFYQKVLGWDSANTPNYFKLGRAYDELFAVYDVEGLDGANKALSRLFDDAHELEEALVILALFHDMNQKEMLPPADFKGKLGNQLGFGEDMGGVKFTGFLDKLAFNEEKGYIVVERKTTSESIEPGSSYWDKLPLDPQIRSYVWYLRRQGIRCGWVCYEVVRKLSSSYSPKLAKKKDNSVEAYRDILLNLNYNKTLVARKWIYIDEEATEEWEQEHATTHYFANKLLEVHETDVAANYDFSVLERNWIKHENSCADHGGCLFRPVCQREVRFETCSAFTKTKGRFDNAVATAG